MTGGAVGRKVAMDGPAPVPGAEDASSPAGTAHLAFFYRTDAEYLGAVAGFVRGALARGEAVLMAVPGARAAPLCEALGADAWRVTFADMTSLGRNPARIIPAVAAFLAHHRGRPVSFLGEPAWPGRSARELVAAIEHEALLSLAFAGAPVTVMCPYSQAGLPARVLADAECTHPVLARGGRRLASGRYLGAGRLPASCLEPLPAPPRSVQMLEYHDGLDPVRAAVSRAAAQTHLPPDRVSDLVLAVSEIAANTLRHTGDSGVVRIWRTRRELICEVTDQGRITDPLAGRVRPHEDDAGGHGLWVVNQICDLVELRSGQQGTTVRMHIARRGHR
jgi:anti-sigma regulatory factor (Ser/Thr protein kinase)